MAKPACVTGLGIVCALGRTVGEVAAAVHREGQAGIRPVTGFDTAAFGGCVAGGVLWGGAGDRTIGFAVEAASEAWRASGLPRGLDVPVVVGSSAGPHTFEDAADALDGMPAARSRWASNHVAVPDAVALALGLTGPRFAPATACASGNVALALALDLVRAGWPVVLVGGSEAISRRRLAGFHALGALARGPCAPFSTPVGMTLGEGAAFFVVESGAHARERGARVHGWLRGYGLSADAWHATAPDPRGGGMARAMVAALADAGVDPGDVDAYAAHGTGTEANDAAEWQSLQSVYGAVPPAIFALKGAIGHAFGASGPQQGVLGLLGMERGWPITAGWTGPREDGPGAPPVVVAGAPPTGRRDVFVSQNAAFGGANATIVFGREGRGEPAPLGPVYLQAVGSASAGDDVSSLRAVLPRVDPRGLDRPGLLLTLAVGRALRGLAPPGGAAGMGLVSGVSRRPSASGDQFRESLRVVDGARGSASAFSRTVMNASTGAAALALGLRGPGATLANGPGAGLHALAWAWWMLATRPEIPALVAAAVDEAPPDPLALDPDDPARSAPGLQPAEGAVAIVLGRTGSLRIAGVGWAGPEHPERALVAAAGNRPVARLYGSAAGPTGRAVEARLAEHVGLPLVPFEGGYGEAGGSLRAVLALGSGGSGGRSAVVSWSRRSGTVAVVFEAHDPEATPAADSR